MTTPTLYLNIDTDLPPELADIEALANRVLMTVSTHTALPAHRGGLEVSLTLVDDDTIQELNRQYRDKDKPTNVLSFPFEDDVPDDVALPLGDVIVSLPTLMREAQEQHKTLSHHFQHMVTHGILHLIGFDHLTDEEANVMENLEVRILTDIDVPNPYDEG